MNLSCQWESQLPAEGEAKCNGKQIQTVMPRPPTSRWFHGAELGGRAHPSSKGGLKRALEGGSGGLKGS